LSPGDASFILIRQQDNQAHRPYGEIRWYVSLQSMSFIDIADEFDRFHGQTIQLVFVQWASQ